METKDVIYELRTGKGLSQEELAEKVFVTRQAVSRWETGETVPNTETLKLLSALFDVSINTLLGTPRQLVCQCAACRWRTTSPAGSQMAAIMRITASGATRGGHSLTKARCALDFLLAHMPNSENIGEAERRAQYDAHLSQLKHWK